ncbi:MAG: hypothetical protein IPK55_13300 [Streptococcus sp.]|nr:hypothetical protein [Streptococcus sp.]
MNSKLEYLNLSFNPIGDAGIKTLSEIINL